MSTRDRVLGPVSLLIGLTCLVASAAVGDVVMGMYFGLGASAGLSLSGSV